MANELQDLDLEIIPQENIEVLSPSNNQGDTNTPETENRPLPDTISTDTEGISPPQTTTEPQLDTSPLVIPQSVQEAGVQITESHEEYLKRIGLNNLNFIPVDLEDLPGLIAASPRGKADEQYVIEEVNRLTQGIQNIEELKDSPQKKAIRYLTKLDDDGNLIVQKVPTRDFISDIQFSFLSGFGRLGEGIIEKFTNEEFRKVNESGEITIPEVADAIFTPQTEIGKIVRLSTASILSSLGAVALTATLFGSSGVTLPTAAATIGIGAGLEGLSAFAAMQRDEENFTEFITTLNPELRNTILGVLSKDEDDSILEASIKNALSEGGASLIFDTGIGSAATFLGKHLPKWLVRTKKVKQLRDKGQTEEALKEWVQGNQEVKEDILQVNSEFGEGSFNPWKDAVEKQKGKVVKSEQDKILDSLSTPATEPKPKKKPTQLQKDIAEETIGRDVFVDIENFEQSLKEIIENNPATVFGEDIIGTDFPSPEINLTKFDSVEDIQSLMQAIARGYQDSITKISPSRTFQEIKEESTQLLFGKSFEDNVDDLATAIGTNGEQLMVALNRDAENLVGLESRIFAGKVLLNTIAKEMRVLSKKAVSGLITDVDMANTLRLQQVAAELYALLKATTKSSARVTASGRISIPTEERLIKELLDVEGRDSIIETLTKISTIPEDAPNKDVLINQLLNQSPFVKKIMQTGGFYWTNNVLMSPETQIVNLVGNGVIGPLHVAARATGGKILTIINPNNPEIVKESLQATKNMYYYSSILLDNFKALQKVFNWSAPTTDEFRAAARVFKQGRPELDFSDKYSRPDGWFQNTALDLSELKSLQELKNRTDLTPDQLNFERIKLVSQMGMRHLINAWGMPIRLLTTTDEFMKQVTYKAHVKSELAIKAVEKGITDPLKISEYVERNFSKSLTKMGQGKNFEALQAARRQTFQNRLKSNVRQEKGLIRGLGAGFKAALGSNVGQVVDVPLRASAFLDVAVNILDDTAGFIPGVNELSSSSLLFATHTPEERSLAVGKLAMGTMILVATEMLFQSGTLEIVGGTNVVPSEGFDQLQQGRKLRSLAINLPNGERITIDTGRIGGVLSQHLSLVSDIHNYFHQMEETEKHSLIFRVIDGIISTGNDLAITQGINNFMRIATSKGGDVPTQFLEQTLGDVAGSMFPRIAQQPDEKMREARTFFERIKKRIDSTVLEPKRNYRGVPFESTKGIITTSKIDKVDVEVERLTFKGLTLQDVPRYEEGKNLQAFRNSNSGQSVYDRWKELMGEIKLEIDQIGTIEIPEGSYSFRDALEKVFETDQYKNSTPETQSALVRTIYNEYKNNAKKVLRMEVVERKRNNYINKDGLSFFDEVDNQRLINKLRGAGININKEDLSGKSLQNEETQDLLEEIIDVQGSRG